MLSSFASVAGMGEMWSYLRLALALLAAHCRRICRLDRGAARECRGRPGAALLGIFQVLTGNDSTALVLHTLPGHKVYERSGIGTYLWLGFALLASHCMRIGKYGGCATRNSS